MKKSFKILLALICALAIVYTSFSSIVVYAVENNGETTELNDGEQSEGDGLENLYVRSENRFEVAIQEVNSLYAASSTSNSEYVMRYRHNTAVGNLIPVWSYTKGENGEYYTSKLSSDPFQDGNYDITEVSNLLQFRNLGLADKDPETREDITLTPEEYKQRWLNSTLYNSIVYSLRDGLTAQGVNNVGANSVNVRMTVTMPKVEGYTENSYFYTLTTNGEITDEIVTANNNMVSEESRLYEETNTNQFQKISVSAYVNNRNGYEKSFALVIGTDNNYYMLEKSQFITELAYTSLLNEGDMEGKLSEDERTWLPPYYEDEDKDAKKDENAVATIKSVTYEDIVKTNDVPMNLDGTPNSEGWYYANPENKREISKLYKFDDYDNTTDNGMVNEYVKLTGSEYGVHDQSPDIKWTFRRINYNETANDDGSITVVITYNLPVDPASIPDGWAPIYDADGTTIHKITKTIKEGENYDKDVVVKQNGTDDTVTTKVTKKWPKTIPQAGESIFVAVASVGVILFAITRKRKLKK